MPPKDPEKAKAYSRKYSKEHSKEARKRVKLWRKNNPDKKRAWYLDKLGWTLELWYAVFKAQDGVCAVCKKVDKNRRLAADHEHSVPPKPRGLLCTRCNTAIGLFEDSALMLESAASYLRKYGSK